VTPVKFRHNVAIPIAALVALLGATPLATASWYLAPILLVPLAVLIWGWRSGTDADAEGLSIRALLGRRRVPWTSITGFTPTGRRVVALLAGGRSLTLPAVTPTDLPSLIAASGQELEADDEDEDVDESEAVATDAIDTDAVDARPDDADDPDPGDDLDGAGEAASTRRVPR
jgi:hypothetical protein